MEQTRKARSNITIKQLKILVPMVFLASCGICISVSSLSFDSVVISGIVMVMGFGVIIASMAIGLQALRKIDDGK